MEGYDIKPLAKCLGIVSGYITSHRLDVVPEGGGELSMRLPAVVSAVWFNFTLGGYKACITSNLPDSRYYEVTFNKDKQEHYLDVYVKEDNVCLPETAKSVLN